MPLALRRARAAAAAAAAAFDSSSFVACDASSAGSLGTGRMMPVE